MHSNYEVYKQAKVLLFIDSFRKAYKTGNYFIPSIQTGITDKCFNKCPMCGHWKRKHKDEMDYDKYIRFLNIAKECGLESVGYSGGDPFSYPQLDKIVEWHCNNNVLFGIVTAGYVPKSFNTKNLEKASWIRMSIDTVDSKLYERIRGGIKCNKVFDSIERLKNEGCNLQIGTVLHCDNVNKKYGTKNINDLILFTVLNKLSGIRFWSIRPHSEMSIDPSLINDVIIELLEGKKILEANGISSNIDTTVEILKNDVKWCFSRCYNTMYQCFITADGNVYPCCSLAGDTEINVRGKTLYNIYDVKTTKDYREFAKSLFDFSEIMVEKLPNGCKKECIPRFIIANNVAEKYWNRKSFF